MKNRRFLVLAAVLVVLAAPATARADTVTDWNGHASTALYNTAAQAPTVGTLHMAMVHGAMYDAVNAIDGQYEPYVYPGRRAAYWASKDAAAATAAYRVLASIVPSQQAQLEQLYHASLASVPEHVGEVDRRRPSVGARQTAMIAARTGDGRFGTPGFPTGTSAGAVASGPARVRERSRGLDAES